MKKNINEFIIRQKAIIDKGHHLRYPLTREVIVERMAKSIAHSILESSKLTVTEKDYHVEFELEIVAVTISEFMKMVNERAEELSRSNNYGNFNPYLIDFIGENNE